MAKYIKILLATISLILMFSISAVSADPSAGLVQDACGGLSQVSSAGCSTGGDTFKTVAATVIRILSIIIGIVSVIMLIFAGFRFITANGDAQAVSSARNMVLYAVVGIIIAVLAQFIVHAVVTTANNVQTNSYLNSQPYISKDS